MINGYATPEGTKKFAERQPEASQQNYKNIHNLTLSNVGVGTYLGNPDTETDKLVEEAIKKFLKSSQLDHNQPRTFLYWGLTLSMQTKYKEAIAKYKTAIQLDPENSSAYAYWGGALTSIGNDKEAAIQLQKSLDINPFNETAYDPLVNSFYNMVIF